MSSAQAAPSLEADLTSLSLEELMDIEITSVARRPQKLSETAAAAFIITAEDIKRSGATTLMDALRMAPGLQVAQIDGNKWVVSTRGFSARFANKLLVLVDGRTVYSSVFSGVLWEGQDLMMEDIDRIEVIRGPGASIWGANAVNGIINIITKSAKESQGTTLVAGGGTHDRAFGAARYGGEVGTNAYYRLFAKMADRASFDEVSGRDGNNNWETQLAGFRIDWEPSAVDKLSFHGNIRNLQVGQSYMNPIVDVPYQMERRPDSDGDGGYLLGNWSRQFSPTSEMAIQLYYSHESYDDINAELQEDTIDVDFQHRFNLGARQVVTWGVGYRRTRTDNKTGLRVVFDPETRNDDLFSAFLQDEVELVKDSVVLSLGSKFEHNEFTGTEIQPSARIRWDIDGENVMWGAISKAVRTPTISETSTSYLGGVLPPMPPAVPFPTAILIVGDESMESETVWAYEIGYRTRPKDWLSLDLTAFYNRYDDLASLELGGMSFEFTPVPHGVVENVFRNETKGHSYGFEAAVDFLPKAWWKLRLAYSWLKVSIDAEGVNAVESERSERNSPEHQLSLLSMMEVGKNVNVDTWFRFVDRLENLDIDSYATLDARIAWTPVEGLELTLVGRNLLEEKHTEYFDEYLNTAFCEIERSIYGKLTCWF